MGVNRVGVDTCVVSGSVRAGAVHSGAQEYPAVLVRPLGIVSNGQPDARKRHTALAVAVIHIEQPVGHLLYIPGPEGGGARPAERLGEVLGYIGYKHIAGLRIAVNQSPVHQVVRLSHAHVRADYIERIADAENRRVMYRYICKGRGGAVVVAKPCAGHMQYIGEREPRGSVFSGRFGRNFRRRRIR
jgi:hypothetical protein